MARADFLVEPACTWSEVSDSSGWVVLLGHSSIREVGCQQGGHAQVMRLAGANGWHDVPPFSIV